MVDAPLTTLTPRRAAAAVGALTLIALGLRLAGLDQALFGDELFTYDLVTRHGLSGLLSEVRHTSITPPLHYLLAYGFQELGDPPVAVRIPSVIGGAATVPLTYWLGTHTIGRAGALAGAAFIALSPFFLFYGTEARAYATLVPLLTFSTIALLMALGSGSRPQSALGWWIGFAVAAAAAIYTHYTGGIYLAAQAAWALVAYRERWRAIVLAYGAVALFVLPWLPSYLDQRRNPGLESVALDFPHGLGPSIGGYASRLVRLVGGSPFLGLGELPGVPALLIMGASVAIGIALVVARRLSVRRSSGPARAPVALLAVLAASLPVGLVLYRLGGTNLFSARNLLASLPAVMLLLGALFAHLRPGVGLGLAAMFACGLVIGTADMFGDDARRPAWNVAARWIDRHVGPGSPVVQGDILAVFSGRRPLLHNMDIFFARPHPLISLSPRTWQAVARSHRVAVAISIDPANHGHLGPPPLGGPWRAERTVRWRGLQVVEVTIWVNSKPSRTPVVPCPAVPVRDHRLLAMPRTTCATITPLS